jgi:hypothetical protein
MSSKLNALTNFHKELNPELWKNNQLDREVRYKLLQIAQAFIQYINIDDLDLEDITISGSNCSFNYTPQSDIDLHLVVDSSSRCWPHLQELYMAKKSLFNDNHDITGSCASRVWKSMASLELKTWFSNYYVETAAWIACGKSYSAPWIKS